MDGVSELRAIYGRWYSVGWEVRKKGGKFDNSGRSGPAQAGYQKGWMDCDSGQSYDPRGSCDRYLASLSSEKNGPLRNFFKSGQRVE